MIFVTPNGSVYVASTASFVTPLGAWQVAAEQAAATFQASWAANANAVIFPGAPVA